MVYLPIIIYTIRMEIRLEATREEVEILEEAAKNLGVSLTAFLIVAGLEKALYKHG